MDLTKQQLENLIASSNVKFSKADFCKGASELVSCGNLLSLVVYDYEHNENYEMKEKVHKGIKNTFYSILYKGCEPSFDNGHNWGYPMLAQAITLIRRKDPLWNLFNTDEQNRLEWIMRMFSLMWNFGCNAKNNFRTGIGLHGNYTKKNSPNYALSNNILIIYCIEFFGNLENVSKWMKETPYEIVINKLEEFNWQNALATWTTPGFELPDGSMAPGAQELYGDTSEWWTIPTKSAFIKETTNGINNYYYKGYGRGCRLPFYYDGHPDKDWCTYPSHIYINILKHMCSGGSCISSLPIEQEEEFAARIKDNTISPYEGKKGLMLEFNMKDDSMGQRSSLYHCEIDFYLAASLITTLKLLGRNILTEDEEMHHLVIVGMNDFLYKKEHGYIGYSLGNIETSYPNITLPLWIDYWRQNFAEV